jgi:4-hydroxybenzoate polyprenyltransferase
LAACILAYDGWLKPTPAGPLAMGACRMFNVLLGMSTGVPTLTEWNLAGYGAYQLVVAGGIGVYIAGVTWFARTEARESRRWPLVLATAAMLGGVGLLAFLHRTLPFDRPPGLASEGTWMLLLALLAATILRRCAVAVAHPAPAPVQMAVRHAILSLIVLDAAVVAEASDWRYGAGVLVLLVPALLVGRWIEST